jgi:hypothetical protein
MKSLDRLCLFSFMCLIVFSVPTSRCRATVVHEVSVDPDRRFTWVGCVADLLLAILWIVVILTSFNRAVKHASNGLDRNHDVVNAERRVSCP